MKGLGVAFVTGLMGFITLKVYVDYKYAMKELAEEKSLSAVVMYENEQLKRALKKARKENDKK